ncbi:hypothetical protein BVJ64_15590 [Vibrio cholerae]|uniref:hypothetical protein n=1 Tax=Vibrio cholerae TaxID=666 RepID=UPI00096B7247|nr:hypothetical protein [Vibrio cholerae]MBO1404914.1 hypothetical protein [Vibrio cholerae]WOQ93354.1 hypothetical protein R4533_12575 [Vibrio cholerae]
MKVLLLGEYSGFHKNLQSGLRKLGCEVVVASFSDGWKKIDGDISLGSSGVRKIDVLINQFCIGAFKALPRLKDFDVVQIINPVIFPCHISGLLGSTFLNQILINRIIESSERSYLVAAGNDAYYRAACENKYFRYSPLEDEQIHDYRGALRKLFGYDWSKPHLKKWNVSLARSVNGVIPITYEYSVPYRSDKKVNLCETIPMPINVDNIPFMGVPKSDGLIFSHGLNRFGFKGTKYIEKAFKLFKAEQDKHDCFIHAPMPLNQYLKGLEQVSVVVDQTNSYSYAMNALYSMALGKMVLSGCENECIDEYKIKPGAFLGNILPDELDILAKMKDLCDNVNLAYESESARQFVIDNHHDKKIAGKYLEIWGC